MADGKQYFFFNPEFRNVKKKRKEIIFDLGLLKAADEKAKDTQGPTVFTEKDSKHK